MKPLWIESMGDTIGIDSKEISPNFISNNNLMAKEYPTFIPSFIPQ